MHAVKSSRYGILLIISSIAYEYFILVILYIRVCLFVCQVHPAESIKIRLVSAGKSHCVCVEDWENGGDNRVFAWGFAGYGRLGHNDVTDELHPRELCFFNQRPQDNARQVKVNPQKCIRDILACSTFTLAG